MKNANKMDLPEDWPRYTTNAVRRFAGIMHVIMTYSRSWCANSPISRMRAIGSRNDAESELAVYKKLLDLILARLSRMLAAQRPHYTPEERAIILVLKAGKGWTAKQTADLVGVSPATIMSWERAVEDPESPLFKTKVPVNSYGNFVRMVVLTLSWYCPRMGRRKYVEILARAGLHMAASTAKRIIDEDKPNPRTPLIVDDPIIERKIIAKRPEHTIHVDLTQVPIAGRWRPEPPHFTPPKHPYCWTVLAVVDHFSRACLGFAVFDEDPNSEQVCAALQGVVDNCDGRIKHVITDKGKQFWRAQTYTNFADANKLGTRFGAVGKHGSIAVVERFIRTMKEEGIEPARGNIPANREKFQSLLNDFVYWYNAHRPHRRHDGCTPLEVHRDLPRANLKPRIEPRARWPDTAPCAAPQVPIAEKPGDKPILSIGFVNGRKHLPVIELTSEAA